MAPDNGSFDLLQRSVQRFIQEQLMSTESILEGEDNVSTDIITDMREMGLLSLPIPEEYGDIGLAMVWECEVAYNLGYTALTFHPVFGTNVGIDSQGILTDGTNTQGADYSPRIASGELIIPFVLTEPNVKSGTASLQTRTTPDDDHYAISGTKCCITNAPRAGISALMACASGEDADGISVFIMSADTPGITLDRPDKKMRQHDTKAYDVMFDSVRVPAVDVIGDVARQDFKAAMKIPDQGRLHTLTLAYGMAHRLITDAVAYTKERKQFGQPIVDSQLIRAMLANGQAKLYAGTSTVWDYTHHYDVKPVGKQDHEVSMLASCTEMFYIEMVGRMADRVVQIRGGAGYIAEYKTKRFYHDVRLLRLYEGTMQIQQFIVAKDLLRGWVGSNNPPESGSVLEPRSGPK